MTGPGRPFADRLVVDPHDRQDLDRRPEQDHFVGGQELGESDSRARENGMLIVSARRRTMLPGHSRQDLVPLRRPLQSASTHPDERRMRRLGDQAL